MKSDATDLRVQLGLFIAVPASPIIALLVYSFLQAAGLDVGIASVFWTVVAIIGGILLPWQLVSSWYACARSDQIALPYQVWHVAHLLGMFIVGLTYVLFPQVWTGQGIIAAAIILSSICTGLTSARVNAVEKSAPATIRVKRDRKMEADKTTGGLHIAALIIIPVACITVGILYCFTLFLGTGPYMVEFIYAVASAMLGVVIFFQAVNALAVWARIERYSTGYKAAHQLYFFCLVVLGLAVLITFTFLSYKVLAVLLCSLAMFYLALAFSRVIDCESRGIQLETNSTKS
jgi:magnesium-transporting ATPase (P-type)